MAGATAHKKNFPSSGAAALAMPTSGSELLLLSVRLKCMTNQY